MFASLALSLVLAIFPVADAGPAYSATYLPSNVPDKTEQGQLGTNRCGTGLNQTSMCQNAYSECQSSPSKIFSDSLKPTSELPGGLVLTLPLYHPPSPLTAHSANPRCIWSPPEPGAKSTIGETERIEVAWCLKNGTGARLIPDGTITSAHWTITPDYVQVTGTGNLTRLNVPKGDEGGELDPHGADGNGNPIGGVVFSDAFGDLHQIFEWTNFVDYDTFCFRACNPKGSNPQAYCQHIYDVMGCEWNMPGNYGPGFDSCHADSGEPMGVYGGSTFHQGDGRTPAPHPAPKTTSCTTATSIGNGFVIEGTSIIGPSANATPTVSGSGASAQPTGASGGSAASAGPAATNSSNEARILGLGADGVALGFASAAVFSLIGALFVL
ncbi:hypothetical protein MKEN_00028600 [Mycena kentingensis (nom. inval.)]|nr:hypothetical protein MKEN_00028600 [Mycena kentingensis (nom. inval.)]